MTTPVGKSRKEEGGRASRVGIRRRGGWGAGWGRVQRRGQICSLEDPRENTVKSCRKIVQKIRRGIVHRLSLY